uniref:Uncharacterized protein n=1 Tax=Rhipicephalus pulchellus TaxID=72859 RepID=L7LVL5_RHIPC
MPVISSFILPLLSSSCKHRSLAIVFVLLPSMFCMWKGHFMHSHITSKVGFCIFSGIVKKGILSTIPYVW